MLIVSDWAKSRQFRWSLWDFNFPLLQQKLLRRESQLHIHFLLLSDFCTTSRPPVGGLFSYSNLIPNTSYSEALLLDSVRLAQEPHALRRQNNGRHQLRKESGWYQHCLALSVLLCIFCTPASFCTGRFFLLSYGLTADHNGGCVQNLSEEHAWENAG